MPSQKFENVDRALPRDLDAKKTLEITLAHIIVEDLTENRNSATKNRADGPHVREFA